MQKHYSCLFCDTEYFPTHGNQRYCSPECKEHQKAANQKMLYSILKEFRKGFLGNYKIFSQLLPKPGNKIFSLAHLNNIGFQPSCYYKKLITDKNEILYCVAEYTFQLLIEKDSQKIKLTKY